jgi:hypothetical protein
MRQTAGNNKNSSSGWAFHLVLFSGGSHQAVMHEQGAETVPGNKSDIFGLGDRLGRTRLPAWQKTGYRSTTIRATNAIFGQIGTASAQQPIASDQ